MNIHGLKKNIEIAKKRIRMEKKGKKGNKDELLIRKLQDGIQINKDKIKELRKKKEKK